MLGVQNEREFANFCAKVLDNAALATDSRFSTNSSRTKNRAELKAEIDCVFSKLSTAQVIERLDAAAIANASVNDMQGVWNHPQLKARMDRVPEVGEHNEAIFRELGVER